jgi:hypothetical protein
MPRPIGAVRMVIAVAFLVLLAGCAPLGTKGTMPPPGPNGQVDPSDAPDFIAVAARDGDGIAGYVRKEAVLPAATMTLGRPVEPTWPVYGEDLRTLVGYLVPGKGFVPIGVDPASVPTFRVEVGPSQEAPAEGAGQVALYVRNDSSTIRWFTVVEPGGFTGGSGFSGGSSGGGCFSVPARSRVVLLDRDPQEPGAIVARTIYLRGNETQAPQYWVEIGSSGQLTLGTGVPAWWSGGALAC